MTQLKGISVGFRSPAMNVSGSRTELCFAFVCFMRRENGKFSEKCFDAIKAHDRVHFKGGWSECCIETELSLMSSLEM